jgi:AraC-like DNA-binding protein
MDIDIYRLPVARDLVPQPRIAAAFVRPIALGLSRFGVPSAEVFSALGLSPDAKDGYVPITTVAEVLDRLAERLDMPHLALELVGMLPLGALGAVDYCFSTSATLFHALAHIAPQISLFTEALRFELKIEGDTAYLELRHLVRPFPILTELPAAFVARRLRDVLGDAAVKLQAVRFHHDTRADVARYERFFGAPVHFRAGVDHVAFPADLLKAPLLTAVPSLARILKAHTGEASSLLPRGDPLLLHARKAAATALAEGVVLKLDGMAAALEMSGRSLQRKLAESGTSCSDLVDEARRELATALLDREGILLSDVAYRVGFRDVNALFRAFRRWTGMSPREFQKARGR